MDASKVCCTLSESLVATLGLVLVAMAVCRPAVAAEVGQESELNLVPWPLEVKASTGHMALTAKARVVAADARLLPLAQVLAEEIHQVTGLKLEAVAGKPRNGDIALEWDATLRGERYVLTTSAKRASVRGGTYGAVALGTATLLQTLAMTDGKPGLALAVIADEPAAEFRGVMLDLARKYHTIAQIKQIVRLCRLYKVRYLQLHLTDYQSFMFPSKAYPALTTKNEHGGEAYTLAELKDLVAYADVRNVTIIPEFDVPGHASAMIRAMPDLFRIAGEYAHPTINFGKPDVIKAVETIVGEVCEVFRSSPYFHIGGDEVDISYADQDPEFQAAMKKHNLSDKHELYRLFLVQMHEIVKQHQKQTIVWEGFRPEGTVKIPDDIIVMAYEIEFYQPDALVRDGYRVINASWTPLYVVNERARPPEEIYAWNLYQFKPVRATPSDTGTVVPPTPQVFGAQMCAWEQPAAVELPSLRKRLPAMMERIANPSAGKSFADFDRRLTATDTLLELLVKDAE